MTIFSRIKNGKGGKAVSFGKGSIAIGGNNGKIESISHEFAITKVSQAIHEQLLQNECIDENSIARITIEILRPYLNLKKWKIHA